MMSAIKMSERTILVTGAVGFIGSFLCKRLLETIQGINLIGIDSITDYYDVSLKEERLAMLKETGQTATISNASTFTFIKSDISDAVRVNKIFVENKPSIVVNLAAQAGVRYSITNPESYIKSNINWFL